MSNRVRENPPLTRGLVADWLHNLEDANSAIALASSYNMKLLCGDYIDLWDRHEELRQQHADLREQMTGFEDRIEKMLGDMLEAFEEATTEQREALERFRKERVTR